jgi:hypothetical protein
LGTSAATSKKETTAQQKEKESSRAKKEKEEVSDHIRQIRQYPACAHHGTAARHKTVTFLSLSVSRPVLIPLLQVIRANVGRYRFQYPDRTTGPYANIQSGRDNIPCWRSSGGTLCHSGRTGGNSGG